MSIEKIAKNIIDNSLEMKMAKVVNLVTEKNKLKTKAKKWEKDQNVKVTDYEAIVHGDKITFNIIVRTTKESNIKGLQLQIKKSYPKFDITTLKKRGSELLITLEN